MRADGDDLDGNETFFLDFRAEHHGSEVRHVAENLAAFPDDFLDGFAALFQDGFQGIADIFVKPLLTKIIDVVFVSSRRGNTPRGSVRFFKETVLFQSEHLVSNRGGRDIQAVFLDKGFAPDRFRGLDELFDNQFQDLIASRHGSSFLAVILSEC